MAKPRAPGHNMTDDETIRFAKFQILRREGNHEAVWRSPAGKELSQREALRLGKLEVARIEKEIAAASA